MTASPPAPPTFIFPGDIIATSTLFPTTTTITTPSESGQIINNKKKIKKIRIGPGLMLMPPAADVAPLVAGHLVVDLRRKVVSIERMTGRVGFRVYIYIHTYRLTQTLYRTIPHHIICHELTTHTHTVHAHTQRPHSRHRTPLLSRHIPRANHSTRGCGSVTTSCIRRGDAQDEAGPWARGVGIRAGGGVWAVCGCGVVVCCGGDGAGGWVGSYRYENRDGNRDRNRNRNRNRNRDDDDDGWCVDGWGGV